MTERQEIKIREALLRAREQYNQTLVKLLPHEREMITEDDYIVEEIARLLGVDKPLADDDNLTTI